MNPTNRKETLVFHENGGLLETNLEDGQLQLHYRGKVRDLYRVGRQHLLVIVTDRLSAFDVNLRTPIPGRGETLTALSNYWMREFKWIVPNHISDMELELVIQDPVLRNQLQGRSQVVKRLDPLPIEAIVRGYLTGSGWEDYLNTGMVCGLPLPRGLRLSEELSEPAFTPSTKAPPGEHDRNITYEEMVDLLGGEKLAQQVRDASLSLYRAAMRRASNRGILIADSKFEFGLDKYRELHVMDEILTPDCSRFWAAERYRVGTNPPGFDKQVVRDYLMTLKDWDRTSPGPELPALIVEEVAKQYRMIRDILIPY